jgi:hypothetical protein
MRHVELGVDHQRAPARPGQDREHDPSGRKVALGELDLDAVGPLAQRESARQVEERDLELPPDGGLPRGGSSHVDPHQPGDDRPVVGGVEQHRLDGGGLRAHRCGDAGARRARHEWLIDDHDVVRHAGGEGGPERGGHLRVAELVRRGNPRQRREEEDNRRPPH